MIDTQGNFYLGRIFDPKQGKTTTQPLLYDPDDLTTHAVVVGMTGSGKTGLCIGLLEEAALQGIPALMIDPKGDVTNALLHFPNLLAQDFKPWVNPDLARRDGKNIDQAASEAAASWQKGLTDWDIAPDRIRALQDAAQFAIYTPGSDSGIPVNILASLKAPEISWESNKEILREKISGTVTALLGLVGFQDIDPVRSREHILLSNIFENAWSQGHDLDLGELILQTQTPPFPKLGVFDVNAFFPEKDRLGLAMSLNNILAAPAFQTWMEGQPLDIPSLLYTPDKKPRHSIFYVAHLTDAERMFFITLLYSAVEAWMRTQSGTSSLRAIIYFDEIFGYLPPVANPPSKEPMLRMLKQARAFGVGQVLVTQNPVDVDYKGLSNAGTWFIGKLQTDQDKQRLLDGLESAMSGDLDRHGYDLMISALGKRVFLLHNIHAKQAQLLQTRWTMNYLAGPLTRTQIPDLNKLVGASIPAAVQATGTPLTAQGSAVSSADGSQSTATAQKPAVMPSALTSATRPATPAGAKEYFLPNNLSLAEAFKAAGRTYPNQVGRQRLVYRSVLIGQADIRFLNRKYYLDYDLKKTVLVADPDRRGMVRWDDYSASVVNPHMLDREPIPQALFNTLEAPLTDGKLIATMEKDFMDWVYRTSQVTVHANETLKLYAGPQVSSAEFHTQCADKARKGRDDELKKLTDSINTKIETLQEKLDRKERELQADQTELTQRRLEEGGTILEIGASLFGFGRKRSLTTPISKHRLASQAKADVQETIDTVNDLKKQISDLENEKAKTLDEANKRWEDIANQVSEIQVVPQKKDVLLDLFGVAWIPYYDVEAGGEKIEIPGYISK